MLQPIPSESHIATMDVCLAGVFVGRGERIPDDLYDAWRRRLERLGLEAPPAPERTD